MKSLFENISVLNGKYGFEVHGHEAHNSKFNISIVKYNGCYWLKHKEKSTWVAEDEGEYATHIYPVKDWYEKFDLDKWIKDYESGIYDNPNIDINNEVQLECWIAKYCMIL